MEPGTVLVTGASGGLGGAFAEHFARRGHHLILTARHLAALEDTARHLSTTCAVPTESVSADLTTASGVAEVSALLASRPFDVLVSCAGAGHVRSFSELDATELDAELSLNFNAHVRLVHAAAPAMRRRGAGTIIVVSSLAALIPADPDAGYVAAKAGLVGLIRALSTELNGTDVDLRVWCPGFIHTGIYRAAGGEEPEVPALLWSTPHRTVAAGMKRMQRSSATVIVPERHDRALLAGWRILPGPIRRVVVQGFYRQ